MFALAHLSDPHLGPLPRPLLSELIGKRATGYFHWRRTRHLRHRADVLARIIADVVAQAPDHIVLTGDLVNVSLSGEYAPARSWLQSLGGPRDLTVVPGNHDVYMRATARHAQLHWGDYMRGDDADEVSFPFLRRRGPLALIGLSSGLPTAPLMATGRLGGAQIARLAELLDQCAGEGRFRVVLIHHPPLSKPQRRFKRLVDGSDLRATLARHGAELVLHGHDHEHARVDLDGPHRRIAAVGVPSASEAPPGEHDPAGYDLYRVEGGSSSWRCEAISRGLSRDGADVVDIGRAVLVNDCAR